MISSPSKTWGAIALGLGLGFATAVGAADGPAGPDAAPGPSVATAPPRSILPESKAASPSGEDLGLPNFEEKNGTGPAQSTAPETGGDIEVGTLDSDTGTAPGAQSSEFSKFLWDGSDGKTVLRLLDLIRPGRSRAMQELTRRLLLTDAPPPPGVSENDFLAARIKRLASIGDLDGILELVNRAGSRLDAAGAERIKVDALLLSGDYVGACGYASDELPKQSDAYWLEVVTFCRALNNDGPGTNLSLEMLQDRAVEAPVFYKLISALMQRTDDSEPPVIASMEAPTALEVTMATLLDVAFPADVVDNAPPMVLTRLAGLAAVPLELRLKLAEAATRIGGFEPARLAQIYAVIPFSDDDRANATLLAQSAEEPRANALLYQVALGGKTGMDRALALKAGADRARSAGELALYADVNRDALVTLPPDDALIALAPDVVRLLMLAGEDDTARAWYRFVRDAAKTGNADARAAVVEMWPLLVVGSAAGAVPLSADILDLWWQSRESLPQATSADQAKILYALFEALGHSIPDNFWPDLMGGNQPAATDMPSLPVWRGLLKAASDGHQGETVVYALATLAEGGAARSAPAVLSSVVGALKKVGLDGPARAIALEAMVAHGL